MTTQELALEIIHDQKETRQIGQEFLGTARAAAITLRLMDEHTKATIDKLDENEAKNRAAE